MLGIGMRARFCSALAAGGLVAGLAVALPEAAPGWESKSLLGSLRAPTLVASTVPVTGPATGDQNPYGVAVVPRSVGELVRNRVLVSNFNAAGNLQGTGTTIMQVDPRTNSSSVFA